jgi:hypothetical protein
VFLFFQHFPSVLKSRAGGVQRCYPPPARDHREAQLRFGPLRWWPAGAPSPIQPVAPPLPPLSCQPSSSTPSFPPAPAGMLTWMLGPPTTKTTSAGGA